MKRASVKWLIVVALGGLLCGSLAVVWAGEKKEKNVTLDSLPDAVKQSILKECGEHKLKDIEETTKNGQVIYEADWIVDGKETEIQVTADGKVIKKAEEDAEEDEDEEHEQGQHKDDSAALWTDSFDLGKCTLVSTGRNDYFILEPGYQLVLEHGAEKLEITVLNETRKIGDIETRVVEERETVNGEVKEVSRNFFAFCKETAGVFYFGEETNNYKQGKATLGKDSWVAGTDNAKPGLTMPGLALLGARYYQELAPGKAMDRAEIVSLSDTLDTPAGHFEHCLKTEETNPLERGEKEYKLYAPGIGLIKDEDLLLTHYVPINK